MAESRGWRRLPKEQQLELHKSKDRVCYGALRNTAVFTYHKNPVDSIGFFEVFVAESARIPQTGPIFYRLFALGPFLSRFLLFFSSPGTSAEATFQLLLFFTSR
jgi:hypothetical protein